ncbi:MAG: carbamoyltransferase HypF [Salaquimonas sp.]|nr:carbamoyltransferase HypF [Salaquimonas sp.]
MVTVGWRVRVQGLVQGVGFRPHVWRIAQEEGLAGQVINDGAGVAVEAWGSKAALRRFVERIETEAPPLARIDAITRDELTVAAPDKGFVIAQSEEGDISTGVVPDAATCPACLGDIADPANRRFGYAFTNCTHCGPRLSIVRSIPYDRARTSMAAFTMCADCAREYGDPTDRRFHAQPNACPVCGPRMWLEDENGEIACDGVIDAVAQALGEGRIAAIKGIGGFHLACDATNEEAVGKLRARKRRHAKPFAVMMRDFDQVQAHCKVGEADSELLGSNVAPIVLLAYAGDTLARSISPGHDRLGVMLPYTPLHHLLLGQVGRPLVMTSGNLSDEPQVTDNDEARRKLGAIADLFLLHDRDIVNRLDDSVIRLDAPGPQIIRRGRGMAPEPLRLGEGFSDAPAVLAMGGELKASFCLFANRQATLSQHMGDLEEAATHADYRRNLDLYRDIYRFEPEVIAVDLHPDYLSTKWGGELALKESVPLVAVQHHHAHLASCLAENGIAPDRDMTLGIVLDGLGLGEDGTIWGGELLAGGYRDYVRAGHFLPVALPGGVQAMREPWRNTVAHLRTAFGEDWRAKAAPLAGMFEGKPVEFIEQMLERGTNCPLSSSAGRLFDAVAAALGICADRQHYEGQAAMEMEALARPHVAHAGAYPAETVEAEKGLSVLSWAPLWQALLADLASGVERGVIAARFHTGLVEPVAKAAERAAERHGCHAIALSGGVMQNQILSEGLHRVLAGRGHHVLVQTRVPANDGGLALGQAAIAAVRAVRPRPS